MLWPFGWNIFVAIMSCFPFNTLVCWITKNTSFSMSTTGFRKEDWIIQFTVKHFYICLCILIRYKCWHISTPNVTKSRLVIVYSHQKQSLHRLQLLPLWLKSRAIFRKWAQTTDWKWIDSCGDYWKWMAIPTKLFLGHYDCTCYILFLFIFIVFPIFIVCYAPVS